jgi:hypothetical protein
MRTEEGEEIVDPGIYDLGDDRRLHVFITGTPEHPKMWACSVYDHGPFCRLCQEVDGTLNALLVNVLDGRMTCRQDAEGEFQFKLTQAGTDAVRSMLRRNAEPEGEGTTDA